MTDDWKGPNIWQRIQRWIEYTDWYVVGMTIFFVLLFIFLAWYFTSIPTECLLYNCVKMIP